MKEIVFVVEEVPEGGYVACAIGEAIVTDAEALDELYSQVRDAVQCHFEGQQLPELIRLRFVREEVIAL